MIKLSSNIIVVRIVAISFALLIFFSHIFAYHTDLLSLSEPVELVVTDAETNDAFKEVKTLKKYSPQEAYVFLQLRDLNTSKRNYITSVLPSNPLSVDSPPPEIGIKL
jgi:hypothetical protein